VNATAAVLHFFIQHVVFMVHDSCNIAMRQLTWG
jgi:hypothetical protein